MTTPAPITAADVKAFARAALVKMDVYDQLTIDTDAILAASGNDDTLPATDLRNLALASKVTDGYVDRLDIVAGYVTKLRATPRLVPNPKFPGYMGQFHLIAA